VVRPAVSETTALGAAYLAGLAVGYWKDLEEIGKHWRVDRRFEPGMEDPVRAKLVRGWKNALERSKGWEEQA